ncbi:MAG TPA: hypothetical protein VET25_08040 [Aestuariivirgaceae bacterium]|nr:hypothetical protein [Aestuariivirgaceae bacterium]
MLGKKPLDFIMRQFHDAMKLLLEYERDQSFVPNADQVVLFEIMHSKLRLFGPTSYTCFTKCATAQRGFVEFSNDPTFVTPAEAGVQLCFFAVLGLEPSTQLDPRVKPEGSKVAGFRRSPE